MARRGFSELLCGMESILKTDYLGRFFCSIESEDWDETQTDAQAAGLGVWRGET